MQRPAFESDSEDSDSPVVGEVNPGPVPNIELVRGRYGKYNLREQPKRVQDVISAGFIDVWVNYQRKNAYPDPLARVPLTREVLVPIATTLGYHDIAKRLNDPGDIYCSLVSKIASFSLFFCFIIDSNIHSIGF